MARPGRPGPDGGGPWDDSAAHRRATRALTEAFLARTEGRPTLLPRIAAFGALDEAPLALAGALDLPPAVSPPLRLAQLARLILAMGGRYGAPVTADQAWPLAAELAALMDEAERAEIDLATKLPGLVKAEFAHHWQITLDFLEIVTAAWPGWLAENCVMNPAARQVKLLRTQARSWEDSAPSFPVLAGGSTGGIPAVAELLRVVAGLPGGEVVLPGLDMALPDDIWDKLEDGHPQTSLARLLGRVGARRGDVVEWALPDAAPPGRTVLLNRALLPAAGLVGWRHPAATEAGELFRLSPADQQEEALATALLMRDALETPGRRVALVTPDRDLAGRVAAELRRFGVIADDSAGERLADTPPATFLRLLAEAAAEGLRPVPLLSLLKHPYAAAGLAPGACRAAARGLERDCLRGPAPPPNLAGLQQAARHESTHAFLARLEACLGGLLAVGERKLAAPAEALSTLLAAAEALAGTPDQPGGKRLWAGEDGQALAAAMAELLPALAVLPDQPPATLPGLLEAALADTVIRSRRALRGRDGAEHPPRLHLGPAGSPAATGRRHRPRWPGRRRLAGRRRSRTVDEPPDARRRRGCPRRRRRSARRRTISWRLPAPPLWPCCRARAAEMVPRRCRPGGSNGWTPCCGELAAPCPSTPPCTGPARWTSPLPPWPAAPRRSRVHPCMTARASCP